MPVATTALNNLAPSKWRARPFSAAQRLMDSTWSYDWMRPPHSCVCSPDKRGVSARSAYLPDEFDRAVDLGSTCHADLGQSAQRCQTIARKTLARIVRCGNLPRLRIRRQGRSASVYLSDCSSNPTAQRSRLLCRVHQQFSIPNAEPSDPRHRRRHRPEPRQWPHASQVRVW